MNAKIQKDGGTIMLLEDDAVDSIRGVSFDNPNDTPQTLKIIVRINVRGFGDTEFTFTPFGGTV